jgi:wyosine [tRNA(Phe)-imidazoG37] synthetase (radical SAM superfamily)
MKVKVFLMKIDGQKKTSEVIQIRQLSENDHSREVLGLTYVYAVLSRRSGGLSIGINLTTNHSCNWRCVYCQVPNLQRGRSPAIDLELLRKDLIQGLMMYQNKVWSAAKLKDIAFSGNGEPTSCPNFKEAVVLVLEVLKQFNVLMHVPIVCISNGSMINYPYVQQALQLLAPFRGVLWFKIDAGNSSDMNDINQVNMDISRIIKRLKLAAHCLPVWIQSCFFQKEDKLMNEKSIQDYVNLISQCKAYIQGVFLYTVARPSLLPEGQGILPASHEFLENIAERVRHKGIQAKSI